MPMPESVTVQTCPDVHDKNGNMCLTGEDPTKIEWTRLKQDC